MIEVDPYGDLTPDETRLALCDAVEPYFSTVILRYASHFQDFDAEAFVPLLQSRFNDIRRGTYVSTRAT